MSTPRRKTGPLAPNPELWAALNEGEILRAALEDFYTTVLADERLAHFFEGATKPHIIGKQFNFLRDVLAGSRDYFGFRPRNAHNWMVISDELFDYREGLLSDALRRQGVDEKWVEHIRGISEVFRKQIVKDKPFPRRFQGIVQPAEGYGKFTIDDGAACDGCEGILDPGTEIIYHLRTGKIYCDDCQTDEMQALSA